MSKYIMVTGAAGFIGKHVTQALLERGDRVYAVDRLDYAADPDSLAILQDRYPEHLHLRNVDVRSLQRLPDVDTVIHLAASTHVDNSLTEGEDFVANNVGTTAKLLELVRAKSQHGAPHLVHISTDEVYGSIPSGSMPATISDRLRPTSPYAASKAAADMLVQAWHETYRIPYAILRPTNTYGVGQYPEKLIPKTVRCLSMIRPVPIHGNGDQTRCWLDVHDLVQAILLVVDKNLQGTWNIGGNTEASVIAVVARIAQQLNVSTNLIRMGYERLASDERYSVNDIQLRDFGWEPIGDFWRDLPQLVEAERSRWRW